MKIAIIVAMQKELALILPMMTDTSVARIGAIEFHTGFIGSNEVIALQCGIGKVNAAMGATLVIDRYAPDLVINTGVAAGAGDGIKVMDLVVATSLAHHDFWCIGEEWGRIPGSPRLFLPRIPELPDNPDLKLGLIASGDMFITSKDQIDAIREHYPQTAAVDMESAAIAQVCHLMDTEFMCLRVISDTPWASHDNARQYQDFWEEAPLRSFSAVRQILKSL